MLVPVARGLYHGLWIEMKTRDGRLSREQKKVVPLLIEQGYYVSVCYGWEEAVCAIKLYLLS